MELNVPTPSWSLKAYQELGISDERMDQLLRNISENIDSWKVDKLTPAQALKAILSYCTTQEEVMSITDVWYRYLSSQGAL